MATILSDPRASSAPLPGQPGGFKVDISRGERIGRVSSEWFSRPDDERYLSLSALLDAVRRRAERATASTVETRDVRVVASREDVESLGLILPGRDQPVAPTHWSFGQLCSLVGAPSGYLRQLPGPLAGINMQHGLLSHRAELMKTLETEDGRVELRAVTGPDYGRIWDHELVAAVMKIAGNALFAMALDSIGPSQDVRAFSVHPGGMVTDLVRHMSDEQLAASGVIDKSGQPIIAPKTTRRLRNRVPRRASCAQHHPNSRTWAGSIAPIAILRGRSRATSPQKCMVFAHAPPTLSQPAGFGS